MIRLKNLSKMHRTAYMETVALDNINIHSRKREFVAVMGPSDCCKSTLLNMVGMIDTPNSVEHFFDAAEIASRSENDLVDIRKQNIGFIFQNFNLIDDLSVQENVDLSLLYLGLGKKERKEKVAQALGLVRLECGRIIRHGSNLKIELVRRVCSKLRLRLKSWKRTYRFPRTVLKVFSCEHP